MFALRYLPNVVTLRHDTEQCNGCRRCLEVCPHAVFAFENKKARIVDRDACMECGACALNCQGGAIAVEAGVGCANAIINSALTGKKACCGPPDDNDSGGSSCCG